VGLEADHSSPSSAKIKNVWSCTFSPSVRLAVHTRNFTAVFTVESASSSLEWKENYKKICVIGQVVENILKVLLSFENSDSLRAGRAGDRIPVGMRFSTPVQTGRGAHQASYTLSTGSFPGVKRLGRSVYHSLPSSAEVKGRVELYIYSSCGPSGVNFTFTFPVL